MLTGYSTRKCLHCGKPGYLNVNEDELFAYLTGKHAQEAFPNLSAPLREQIISGTHPECWEEMFAFAEED
jgi:hypothetical protein